MPEIVDKQVVGIGFGFLNDEEIKKLSVKQITNGYSFDTLRQPVRGGLYDRAFGTLDIHEDCATCGLGDKYCPGHAGHLQLAVPVYNVFLFPQLYKLLQVKCMHCHKLRLGSLKKKILEAQLVYIAAGHLVKALDLEQQFLAKAARGSLGTLASAFGDDEDEASPDTQSLLDKLDVEIEKANRLLSRKRGNQLSMNDIQVRTRLIRQFMAAANVKKCAHCSAISPKFRRDGFTKIFVMSNAAAQTANTSQGIRIKSVLTEPAPADPKTAGFATGKGLEKRLESSKKAAAAESAKQKKAKAAKAAAAAKKARRGKAKKGSSDDGESGSDSESDDGGEADLSVDDASDADAEDGMVSPSSVTGKPANLVAAGVMSDAVAVAETNDSRIMLPNEVERHMQCLWSEEHELLSRLFFAEAKYQVAVPAYNAADYRAFFHRVLIVPPSRLRPPRFVGGEAFENEMNVGYRKIFELNDDILRTVNESTRPAAAAASAAAAATSKTAAIKEAAGRAAASGSDAAAAATGGSIDVLADEARNKVIQSWVQLQQQVNLIFDSEKTGSALAKVDTVGIKQLLEKKQGLFRKHMMGKRVNFAARSVISPDPYLHTKEIGVPEIFAKVLTYPQPVTPYNVEEMRQAVINGPDVHPGTFTDISCSFLLLFVTFF
jgi:DNA-directed RNA polymerase I subunit RPA1